MKKIYLAVVAFIFCMGVDAQSAFSEAKFEVATDYKTAEKDVLKAVNYLFTTRYDADDLERLYATEYIMKWMAGTPDFTFDIDEKYSKSFAGDPELLNLYMAALAKQALEHQGRAVDKKYLGLGAVKMVLEYTSKGSNNLKQSNELKKMSAALKKGELEKYLGV